MPSTPSQPSPAPQPGGSALEDRRVGPYRLLERLGAGGMGEVFRARDVRLDRLVALKHIHPDAAPSERARRRFRREARSAARLDHPNVVRIHDLLCDAQGDWIVMELARGQPLSHWIGHSHRSLERILELGREITSALAAAHAEGLIHRDLKAGNVFVDPAGCAKILDFGLAKQATRSDGRSTSLTLDGQMIGTPHAMSPEQALGRPVDLRSDLFSLGSLLYEMTSGRAPFRGAGPIDSVERVCTHDPPSLAEVAEVPRRFSDLVAALLEKNPAHRPRSAAAVLLALQPIDSSARHEVVAAHPATRSDSLAPAGTPTVDKGAESPPSLSEQRQVTALCCQLIAPRTSASDPDTVTRCADGCEFLSQGSLFSRVHKGLFDENSARAKI